MPPRNPELPEGTDHVVNGAMDTSGGGSSPIGGSAGSGTTSGGTGGLAGGTAGTLGGTGGSTGGASTGFIGSGASGGLGGGGSSGSSGGSDQPVKQQLRDGAQSIKSQAADKARSYAVDGKDRATGALDEFAQVVTEAAQTIDERLGAQYGDYARQAAGSITDFSNRLRDKPVDELFNDARDLVRKSPAIAIGSAAAVGFALVRLIKVGIDDNQQGGTGGSPGRQSFSGGGGDPSFGGGAQPSIEAGTPQAPSVGGPTAGV